jgi:tetratricopeptide (TPR) repeat protein
MDVIFTHDRMEDGLLRAVDKRTTVDMPDKKTATEQRYFSSAKKETTAIVSGNIIQMVTILLHNDEFRAIESIVSHSDDRSVADKLVKMIISAAERKMALFQFLKAKKLFALIACGELFTMRQREDAAVSNYMLQKNHFETTAEELLTMIEDYRKRFPEGISGDYMTAEAITMLYSMKAIDKAVIEMKRLLRRFPTSPHNEYCRYLYANTLRENLDRTAEALDEYKKYVAIYPHGKYEEDALYRIIELERSKNDKSNSVKYAKIYLRNYPHGRWSEEVRAMDVV